MNKWKLPLFLRLDEILMAEINPIELPDCVDSVIDVKLYDFKSPPCNIPFSFHCNSKKITIMTMGKMNGYIGVEKILIEITYYSIQKDREYKLEKIL